MTNAGIWQIIAIITTKNDTTRWLIKFARKKTIDDDENDELHASLFEPFFPLGWTELLWKTPGIRKHKNDLAKLKK